MIPHQFSFVSFPSSHTLYSRSPILSSRIPSQLHHLPTSRSFSARKLHVLSCNTLQSSSNSLKPKQQAILDLQHASTPYQILDIIHKNPQFLSNPIHLIPSLYRISRLALQPVHSSNTNSISKSIEHIILSPLLIHLSSHSLSISNSISIFKSLALLSLPKSSIVMQLIHVLHDQFTGEESIAEHGIETQLDGIQISALDWSYQIIGFQYEIETEFFVVPKSVREFMERLPFRVIPNGLKSMKEVMNVERIKSEVHFKRDLIQVGKNGQKVEEQRQTAWISDEDIVFEYSGKSMKSEGNTFNPLLKSIGDEIVQFVPVKGSESVKFDGLLVNLYENGRCSMGFHSDPGVGEKWSDRTAVVSIGDTRVFAFRNANEPNDQRNRFEFHVRNCDVVVMFDDCQSRFQHAIKPEKHADNASPRISLVYKEKYRNA